MRADHPDPAAFVHGVVAPGGTEAVFAYVQLTTSADERPGAARLPGLDAGARLPGRGRAPGGRPGLAPVVAAGVARSGRRDAQSGRALAAAGLQMPVLQPEQALLVHATATG